MGEAISRRDFLKLSALGLAGLALRPLGGVQEQLPGQQGRAIYPKISVYDTPSLKGVEIKNYWKDMVFPISAVTVGDEEPAHNRIWYRIGEEGYAHSGGIQPVQTRLNQPAEEIPPGGALVEVTVPFTDAHWGPGKNFLFAYRFYYETVYWANAKILDEKGEAWYSLPDDKWDLTFFAPAAHFRILPQEELSPLSPHIDPLGKRLQVRLEEQLAVAYEYEEPVFMARIASGTQLRNGRYLTPEGRHSTFHKRPTRHMAAGDLAANGYDLPGVPWISYITEKGVSFHGTYWHNDYGRPRSHGCINLTPAAAKWIYRWTMPVVPPEEEDVYKKYGTWVDVVR